MAVPAPRQPPRQPIEDDAYRAALALRIWETSRLVGDFTLRSGATATEYFDKYRFEADPVLVREVVREIVDLLPPRIEAIAGLELGGVPLAVIASQICRLPTLFVRKQRKTYGTELLAEGGPIKGRRIVVIEDVVTSGGQVAESCRELRDGGAEIAGVVCVIDREQGGRQNLQREGLELRSVFTSSELDRARKHADAAASEG